MAICFNYCTCEEAENRNPKSRKKAIKRDYRKELWKQSV